MIFSRKYGLFFLVVVAMFFAWSAWGLALNKTSPFASPEIALPLFYGTGALAVLLSFFVFSLFFRLAFFSEKTIAYHANAALRQSVFFMIFVVSIAIFQQFQILTPPIAVIIFFMIMLGEAFFWERKNHQ